MAIKKDQSGEPLKFMPGELIAAAHVFKTTPEIMTGALNGVKAAITKDQAKERLESFLKKPINKKGV